MLFGLTTDEVLLSSGIFLASWLLTTFMTRGYRVSLLDDLGSLNITVAFSFTMVFLLSRKEIFPDRGIIEITVLISAFYLGIFLFSLASDTKLYRREMSRRISEIVKEDQSYGFCISAFIIFLATSLFFFVLQLGADSPDERNIFADQFRVLDILRSGSSVIVGYILLVRMLVLAEKKTKGLVASFFLVGLLSGSKSALLGFLHMYLTARGIVKDKLKAFSEVKFLALWGTLGLAFAMAVVFFYTKDIVGAAQGILFRLLLSGDIYLYSYVTGDYRELIDTYNPVTYVLHPFLRLVGLKGYDAPIGSKLMAMLTGSEDFGPNPHLPIVLMIFNRANLFVSAVFALAIGGLVVAIKRFLIDILTWTQWPAIWRLAFFFALFESAGIFIDFQLYSQRIISVFCVVVVLSIFQELRGGRYVSRILKQ